jgi:hypothetical protein
MCGLMLLLVMQDSSYGVMQESEVDGRRWRMVKQKHQMHMLQFSVTS